MATLERRVEALERSNASPGYDFVFLVSFVASGNLDAPLLVAMVDSERYESKPGESEENFRDRVNRTVQERFPAGKRRLLIFLSERDLEL